MYKIGLTDRDIKHVLDRGTDLPWKVAILEFVWPIRKLCLGVSSEMDHSVVNNGMTRDAAFCRNSVTTCY